MNNHQKGYRGEKDAPAVLSRVLGYTEPTSAAFDAPQGILSN